MKKRKSKRKQKSGQSLLPFIIVLTLVCVIAFFALSTFMIADAQKKSGNQQNAVLASAPTDQNAVINPDVANAPVQSGLNIKLADNLEIPLCGGTKGMADHQIRAFHYYQICYRESYEQAEWSAYRITEEELVKNTSRSDNFRADPNIDTGSADLLDYKKSGYDRGHLTPAADMAFSEEAMSETFYMSNMSPQEPNFNRGIWKSLEELVRVWTKRFGRAYVVSGPLLDKPSSEYKSIGKNNVSVPDFYYKVILVPLYSGEEDKMTPNDTDAIAAIGFILPNSGSQESLLNYAVCVDEVEKQTGIDFYSLLDDDVEDDAESTCDTTLFALSR